MITPNKYTVIFSEEVDLFLETLPPKDKAKILYNIKLIEGGILDNELFKKLEGSDIWELRTIYKKNCYRILAFWDTRRNALIVTTHGFIKKTQKTPLREIERAETIRKEYFNQKK